jgi:hypothetical protein
MLLWCAFFLPFHRHLKGVEVGVIGRKRLFDEADLVDLHNEITDAAVSLSAKTIAEVKKTMQS